MWSHTAGEKNATYTFASLRLSITLREGGQVQRAPGTGENQIKTRQIQILVPTPNGRSSLLDLVPY